MLVPMLLRVPKDRKVSDIQHTIRHEWHQTETPRISSGVPSWRPLVHTFIQNESHWEESCTIFLGGGHKAVSLGGRWFCMARVFWVVQLRRELLPRWICCCRVFEKFIYFSTFFPEFSKCVIWMISPHGYEDIVVVIWKVSKCAYTPPSVRPCHLVMPAGGNLFFVLASDFRDQTTLSPD